LARRERQEVSSFRKRRLATTTASLLSNGDYPLIWIGSGYLQSGWEAGFMIAFQRAPGLGKIRPTKS
jgi:hypothetical protein